MDSMPQCTGVEKDTLRSREVMDSFSAGEPVKTERRVAREPLLAIARFCSRFTPDSAHARNETHTRGIKISIRQREDTIMSSS